MSRNAMLSNDKSTAVAERILQLAELGRRLETEREKVQPFYTSTIEDGVEASEEVKNLEKRIAMEAGEQTSMSAAAFMSDGSAVDEWGCLQNYHKKFNKVIEAGKEKERARERGRRG